MSGFQSFSASGFQSFRASGFQSRRTERLPDIFLALPRVFNGNSFESVVMRYSVARQKILWQTRFDVPDYFIGSQYGDCSIGSIGFLLATGGRLDEGEAKPLLYLLDKKSGTVTRTWGQTIKVVDSQGNEGVFGGCLGVTTTSSGRVWVILSNNDGSNSAVGVLLDSNLGLLGHTSVGSTIDTSGSYKYWPNVVRNTSDDAVVPMWQAGFRLFEPDLTTAHDSEIQQLTTTKVYGNLITGWVRDVDTFGGTEDIDAVQVDDGGTNWERDWNEDLQRDPHPAMGPNRIGYWPNVPLQGGVLKVRDGAVLQETASHSEMHSDLSNSDDYSIGLLRASKDRYYYMTERQPFGAGTVSLWVTPFDSGLRSNSPQQIVDGIDDSAGAGGIKARLDQGGEGLHDPQVIFYG